MRILHMIPDIGISNGVMSVILNYAKAMPDDVKFDVIYFKETEKTKQKQIEALGGKVYKINPPSPQTLLKGEMHSFFKNHKGEWDALHIHAPHFAIFIAPAAKRFGINKICRHCHSTWYSLIHSNNKRNKLFSLLGKRFVDKQFACGKEAGRFWYGKDDNFTVLSNAIDYKKYLFNNEIRTVKRNELNVSDNFVIGHIGRVYPPQKNHPYLLKIFAQIKKFKSNAVLLLAGAEYDDNLAQIANSLGILDSVVFLGLRNDIPELLQAFDVMVFPSFKEGLPVAVVEAQAADLPVVMSDTITDEVIITDKCKTLSLNENPQIWAEACISLSKINRRDIGNFIKNSCWNIFNESDKLLKYYTS